MSSTQTTWRSRWSRARHRRLRLAARSAGRRWATATYVDEATWQRVQALLASKNQSGEKHRIHHHYLKGSLYCGGCGSRMVVSINRNRYGTRYPYFVCLGRHQKRTNCTLKYVRIETVE